MPALRAGRLVLGYARCALSKPEPTERYDDLPDWRRAGASRNSAARNALETGQYRNNVHGDFMGGIRSGVNGTPAFFINGVRHDGPYDYASLVARIQMRSAAATGT